MNSSDKTGPLLRTSDFRFSTWSDKEFTIFLINAALLLMVSTCGVKFIYIMLISRDLKSGVFVGTLTALAFAYNCFFAQTSVRGFERQDKASNITNIIRMFAFIYFLGVCVIYAIVIWKLAEKDYGLGRYFQYIGLLGGTYIAVRYFSTIPKRQDVWLLAVLVVIMNLVHATSMITQYVILEDFNNLKPGLNPYRYFFQDIFILIGMAGTAVYTLFGSWRVK